MSGTQEEYVLTKAQVIFFGAIGGCCPTIAKLASYFSTHWGAPMPEIGVVFAMLLFALLGAIISFAVSAQDIKAALIAGIAAPGIITNIVNAQDFDDQNVIIENNVISKGSGSYLHFLGIGAAIAQSRVKKMQNGIPEKPNRDEISGKPNLCITIHSVLSGLKYINKMKRLKSNKIYAPIKIVPGADFVAGSVMKMEQIGRVSLIGDHKEFMIPSNVKMISVLGKSFDVKNLKGVKIIAKALPYRDFYWALGGGRKYKISNIEITPQYSLAKIANGAKGDTGNLCGSTSRPK